MQDPTADLSQAPEQSQSARMRSVTVAVPSTEGPPTYVSVPRPTAQALQEGASAPTGAQAAADAPDPTAAILRRPSARPGEPITQGSPFGAGSNILRLPGEEEAHFRARVSGTLLKSPGADDSVKQFVQRYMSGA